MLRDEMAGLRKALSEILARDADPAAQVAGLAGPAAGKAKRPGATRSAGRFFARMKDGFRRAWNGVRGGSGTFLPLP